RWTSPLPTVAATAVPNVSGAMKFHAAAQTTAGKGLKTRVETIVAIELAASCHPFVKSKARLITTIRTRRWKGFTNRASTYAFFSVTVSITFATSSHL